MSKQWKIRVAGKDELHVVNVYGQHLHIFTAKRYGTADKMLRAANRFCDDLNANDTLRRQAAKPIVTRPIPPMAPYGQ